ncbi:calcium-binding protein [uncultured Roseobacter sp.]|uniref:calcium-binding protein n=1 Tax=uncultured Roseobacter sp. TaxID=114847 RepID=UPI0026147CD5|nr:calcium-binding protein [uncultured Roseobacter sp.]
MVKPAKQIDPIAIKGTGEADYIYIVGLDQDPVINGYWNHDVFGYGGDDVIRFNPVVDWDYMTIPNFEREIHFNGRSGTDEVSLQDSHHPITVNLASGTGTVHIPPVSCWTPSGWQNADLAIEMTFSNVENISGGQGGDHIIGDGNANCISGNDGHDSVRGGDNNDTLNGGNGKDTLKGDDGNDRLNGGHGNDSMWGGDGQDTLEGGAGDDALYGGDGLDFAIFDTNGDMHVDLEGGIAWGGGLGTDLLYSIERVQTGGGDDDVIGTEDANVMWMGAGEDTVYGFDGNDSIKGHAGDDLLVAGEGADSVYGGDGDDRLYGEKGQDMLSGGDGHDTMNGGQNDDQLYGGEGNDRMLGEGGNDVLEGGDGHDYIDGGLGINLVLAGNGNDTIVSGSNTDIIYTGDGEDVVQFNRGTSGGTDIIYDFDVLEDEFAFEAGYFFKFLTPPASVLYYLHGVPDGEDTLLYATVTKLTSAGEKLEDWEYAPEIKVIAVLEDVNAALLNQQIADYDIFHTELDGRDTELPLEFEPQVAEEPTIVEGWSMF